MSIPNCTQCGLPATPLMAGGYAFDCGHAMIQHGPIVQDEAEMKRLGAPRPADPLAIIADAVARGFDADQLGKLMDLQERYEKRKAETAYWEAMSECQAEMPAIFRDKKNAYTNKTYASFESLNKAIRPIYTKHGFSLTFTEEPGAKDGFIRLVCDVGHRDGHHRRHQGDYPVDGTGSKGEKSNMNAIQATGSTHSYAKRYLCKDIFNLAEADEDDDGQAGSTIDGKQIEEINTLLEELENRGRKVKFPSFLAWLNVESLDKLPSKEHAKAIDWLNKKLKEAGKPCA